jgi:hypothetical protein
MALWTRSLERRRSRPPLLSLLSIATTPATRTRHTGAFKKIRSCGQRRREHGPPSLLISNPSYFKDDLIYDFERERCDIDKMDAED